MKTIIPYKGTHPRLHPSVFVADGAVVIGDVEIGQDSSIWFGSVVRGDVHSIRIGERTNIQDCCILHVTEDQWPLFVGDEVTAGHRVTLHGCTIKSGCLIGMGAIVLDGSEIGEGAIIGAGSVVPAGTVIPPGKLALGVPARVRRDVSESERDNAIQLVNKYAQHAKEFLIMPGPEDKS